VLTQALPSNAYRIVYLKLTQATATERVAQRHGHYFSANMVQTQFDILEEPNQHDNNVLIIDASDSIRNILDTLQLYFANLK
jgi:carbohydrate kinase (thermoresistant glucokinase family)